MGKYSHLIEKIDENSDDDKQQEEDIIETTDIDINNMSEKDRLLDQDNGKKNKKNIITQEMRAEIEGNEDG